MRYVPINCIRDGMKLGKKLLGPNGELLLNEGAVLLQSYLGKIRDMGYGGLYVQDDISKDIEIIEIISEELRFKAVKAVRDAFNGTEKKAGSLKAHLKTISDIVNSIVDSVLENRHTMLNVMDLKTFDDYTYLHSTNVTVLALMLGVSLNYNKTELQKLGLAAILHDIGKIFVPKEILNKPARLSAEEFEIVQGHSGKGYEYLKANYDFPMPSYLGVLQHHEKFDGSGYPVKLGGEQIHMFGRIIAIADVYDALTSNRPYRKAMLPSEGIEYIMANGGNHFDPAIVDYFIRQIAPYPIGIMVKLSNNTSGIVMENFRSYGLRPKVRIIRQNGADVEPYVLDLKNDPTLLNVTIVGMEEE